VTIALVADLHGNRPAMQALETHLKKAGADRIWCLGDLVGKGPHSDYTFDWAMANCQVVLGGNWDYGVGFQEYPNDAFFHRQLGKRRLQALTELPLEKQLTLSGRNIRLVHGRPVMHGLLSIQDSREKLAEMLEPDYDVFIYADTHRQGLRTLGGQVANVGSVGNALGLPMVQFALLCGEPGPEKAPLEIRMMSLPYDNQQAARDARDAAGLPFAQAYEHEVLTGNYAGFLRDRSGLPSL